MPRSSKQIEFDFSDHRISQRKLGELPDDPCFWIPRIWINARWQKPKKIASYISWQKGK